jgi:acyl-CoA synthetase (AMP-forming)/AMP-acid ligase II
VDLATQAPTVSGLLGLRAREQPDGRLYRFLEDGACTEELSRGDLDRAARVVGAWLQEHLAPGQRVLLLYPPGLSFLKAFFGCLYGGMVAVPAYPPNPARLERDLLRLVRVAEDSEAEVVLTTDFIKELAGPLFEQAPALAKRSWVATDALDAGLASSWRPAAQDGRAPAFIQYTSGSTGEPKGVVLSHHNLMSNLELIHRAFGTTPDSRGVFWLPLYHDMGLIGGVLETLYCGGESVLMSPLDFLRSPSLWLEAISRHQASISGAPNFAYDLCVRKIAPEQREALDLSHWTLAFNGAEPISAKTLDRFSEAFRPCGFRREAFYPCYGLAEATLIVAGGSRDGAPTGCGLLPGSRVLIVEPESGVECDPGRVGEIWVQGESVAQGYWRDPERSAAFQARLANGDGPFLRTGDLGFVLDGTLFVTGRIKDLIISGGRNHHPQDIEHTVESSHPAVRPGGVAAFAVPVHGEERLVVLAEVGRRHGDGPAIVEEEVVAAIRRAVSEQHELRAHAIRLVKPGSLPKTSSGKIQRFACRDQFLAGDFEQP